MRELWRLFGTELLWITIPGLLAIAFGASRLRRGARPQNIQIVARTLIVVGALVAGAMLFSPVSKTTHARFLDLDLLSTLHASFHNRVMFSQMVGNLLLLSWLGFLLPLAFRGVRPWMSAVAVLLASAAIETVQYVIAVGRVSSVSDVFFNTIGGVVGAVLAAPLRAHLPPDGPRTIRPVAGYGTVPS